MIIWIRNWIPSTPPEMVQGFIAGGDRALRNAVEGCEDSEEDGIRLIVEKLDKNRIEKVHVYLPEKDPETLDNTES